MHPQLLLEILTETGLIGFVNVGLIFLVILYYTFLLKKYFLNSKLKDNHIITPFYLSVAIAKYSAPKALEVFYNW